MNRCPRSIVLPALLATVACAPAYGPAIPDELTRQIDTTLTFAQIKDDPLAHRGAILELGGEVLSAKRLSDHTRLTILQLPLNDDHEPVGDRTKSQGRFIAIQTAFLDPATVPPGTRITIVGELTGAREEPLDEMPYTYPIVSIKHLTVWPSPLPPPYWYPPPFAYSPYPYAYGPYWGPYPYWYWW